MEESRVVVVARAGDDSNRLAAREREQRRGEAALRGLGRPFVPAGGPEGELALVRRAERRGIGAKRAQADLP